MSPVAIAIQPDGRVLVGDWYYFHRLQSDGSYDSFDSWLYSFTTALLVQADGQIFVGADYYSSPNYTRVARVNPGQSATPIDAGLNAIVYAAALQPDGKVLAAGFGNGPSFTNRIARVNPDDTVDTNFNAFASYTVYNLTVQPDGKILVGGFYGFLDGVVQQIIGRLNNDGTLDPSFAPSPIGYINGAVQTMLLQPDGKILIGGAFTVIDGYTRKRLARLHPDGTVDTSFDAGEVSGIGNHVNSLALQANGKILVSGDFTTLAGHACTNVGRLNPDGSFDASYEGSVSPYLWADGLALHPDGSLFVTAEIFTPNGEVIPFARFINTDPATNNLTRSASTLIWSRGGAVPEVWRTIFEASTNGGKSWFALGNASRITGGWQLTNVSTPPNATVRARGYYTSGRFNASSSIDEKIIGPPVIVLQPEPQTNVFGASIKFRTVAGGSEPLTYQWRKDGTNLSASADISGTTTPLLTLSNIFAGRDQADYSLVVSNSFGSVTSLVAGLTVIEPIVLVQPVTNQWGLLGATVQKSVTAGGTSPLSYQWRRDGTNIPGADQAIFTINHAQPTDAGIYDVVINNAFGSVTSDFSALTITRQMPDSLLITNDTINGFFSGYFDCIAFQSDGRMLIGGDFSTISGQPCVNLARINLDGSLDTTFNPSPDYAANNGAGFVSSFAIQPDGKIVIGGFFTAVGGLTRSNIARLNLDGSVDSTFNPGVQGSVTALAVQPDGKIVVGGYFDRIAGQNRTNLARLNANGTLDPAVNSTPEWNVRALALTPDSKIILGGKFDHVSGQAHTNIARLNSNGTLDATFTASAGNPFDFNCEVYSLAVQKDGRILVGGRFSELNGQPCLYLGRLNSDGSHDATFQAFANNYVYSLAIQADGKILPSGTVGDTYYRLEADGTIDPLFKVHIEADVGSSSVGNVGLAPDGKIILTGGFMRVNGLPREGFCRLLNDPAPQTLNPGSSTITWQRGGSSPEVWRTTFEYSTNGSSWISLGSGTRIDGGWQASSAGLPANSMLRARGFVNGGSSQWLVEDSVPVGVTLFPSSASVTPFAFQARVAPGQLVVIEASTNLVNWTAIHTNSPAATNLIDFADPDSGLFERRFYRVHAP